MFLLFFFLFKLPLSYEMVFVFVFIHVCGRNVIINKRLAQTAHIGIGMEMIWLSCLLWNMNTHKYTYNDADNLSNATEQ